MVKKYGLLAGIIGSLLLTSYAFAVPPQPTITVSKNHAHDGPIIVVIDPGHGGKDPGTTGSHNIKEKNVVLKISKDLQQDINKEKGFHAKLTRKGDYFIPLRGRLKIAREDKADMFVAIHADAYKDHKAHGVSVFALSEHGATSEAARWVAHEENKSELKYDNLAGINLNNKSKVLRSVLINLSQTATTATSIQVGDAIINQVSKVTDMHHHGIEQAAFVVLKSPDIPSLLVETGFLSNPKEANRLNNPAYQEKIAHALAKGIVTYYRDHPIKRGKY